MNDETRFLTPEQFLLKIKSSINHPSNSIIAQLIVKPQICHV